MDAPSNININVPRVIKIIIICVSAFNFLLCLFVIQFHIRHPETRKKFGNFFVMVLFLEAMSAVCYISSYAWVYHLETVSWEVDTCSPSEYSFLTNVCIYTGYVQVFTNFLQILYCLFIALLLKKTILKPTAKPRLLIIMAHLWSWVISIALLAFLIYFCTFGVTDDLQCGLQNQLVISYDGVSVLPIISLLPI